MDKKYCRDCQAYVPLTEDYWYKLQKGWSSYCRPHHRQRQAEALRQRRANTDLRKNRPRLKHNALAHAMYQRARRKKCTLTKEWIRQKLLAGVCEATGIRFSFSDKPWDPFQPSLDRKNLKKGYTKDNVQVVVLIHNMARGQWGDKALITYVKALIKKSRLTKK